MNFKEWLFNEDPNGLTLGVGNYDYCDYRDADAVAFIVYRGGHIRAPGHDHTLTHVSMYLSALAPGNPLSDRVSVVGNPPRVRGMSKDDDRRSGGGRGMLMPHMLLGRIWTGAYCWSDESDDNRGSRRRVVSFWNPPAQVYPLRGEVLSMIRGLDMEDEYTPGEKGGLNDPREYLYEVEGNMMGYDEFMAGHSKETAHGWDPAKLHTMEPGPAKKMLMGRPAPFKGPDLATKMKTYTGD